MLSRLKIKLSVNHTTKRGRVQIGQQLNVRHEIRQNLIAKLAKLEMNRSIRGSLIHILHKQLRFFAHFLCLSMIGRQNIIQAANHIFNDLVRFEALTTHNQPLKQRLPRKRLNLGLFVGQDLHQNRKIFSRLNPRKQHLLVHAQHSVILVEWRLLLLQCTRLHTKQHILQHRLQHTHDALLDQRMLVVTGPVVVQPFHHFRHTKTIVHQTRFVRKRDRRAKRTLRTHRISGFNTFLNSNRRVCQLQTITIQHNLTQRTWFVRGIAMIVHCRIIANQNRNGVTLNLLLRREIGKLHFGIRDKRVHHRAYKLLDKRVNIYFVFALLKNRLLGVTMKSMQQYWNIGAVVLGTTS
mmetsp:Transcript_953/g.1833  ORF Transcript_953/g.1833 Transcript_953/m.1833 type:complete len:351 (+) Transcript_953:1156-2208(+)